MKFLEDYKGKKMQYEKLNKYRDNKFGDVGKCKDFLEDNNIGILDIAMKCIHNNNSAAIMIY